ncbi:Spy0128 family protein [Streptococcus anginosus]|uniref:LPXTG cell wall anchor domain-containing protein n=1 Tax=Streptococcus anginosus TaxID=1328 RepID=A0AAP2P1N4_STRAP|nr:FctA domain-containing protein [Streptococcus anginosus]MBZ2156281.1 LPXTG cell wall anchor domain-containing protein [Streptococcus anginosus]
MIKKAMNLVGVALLLASTILSPASAVAQTLSNQSSTVTTQSSPKTGTTEQPTSPTESTQKTADTSSSQEQQPATENKAEANSNKQENKPSTSKEESSDASQVKEETSSQKASKVEEKSETQPGAPPAAKDTKDTQAAPKTKRAAKEIDAITQFSITDKDGKPLNKPLQQWEQFKIDGQFKLPNNDVHEGDYTTFKISENLVLVPIPDFDIKDPNGQVVARANVDTTNRTLKLIYTKYVENKSDITGSFYFYTYVNHHIVKEKKKVPIEITVNRNVVKVGEPEFGGLTPPTQKDLAKVGNFKPDNTITYDITVNQSGKEVLDAKVTDILKTPNVSYDKNSFEIYKGKWVIEDNRWVLKDKENVTSQFKVEFPSESEFFIKLGKINKGEGYHIKYKAKPNYKLQSGEVVENIASLWSSETKIIDSIAKTTYLEAGGSAEGYVYSITLHKKDETSGSSLAGAVFRVTRDRNGAVVGNFTTDSTGKVTIPNLLKDNYTIKEIKAPDGYQLTGKEIKVKPENFNSSKSYSLDISNKRQKVSATLQVNKKLVGRTLKDNEFEFTLTDKQTNQTQKAKNVGGKVTFKSIEYDKEGVYQYKIEETGGSTDPAIHYDSNIIYAKVTVGKDKTGKLTIANITYEAGLPDGTFENRDTFTNLYIPQKTKATLTVKKVLTGRKLQKNEFEFDLKENGQVLQTVKNAADGKVQFKELEYTKAGTYHYTISEKAGDVPGVEYEPNLISATVTVEDKGGKLEVTKVTYSKAGEETKDPTFINRYTPGKTFARLEVNKILTGRQLQKDEFEFELTGKEDHIHQTKKNTAAGKVQFDTVEYTKAGEYHYTIKEKNNGLGGITYDSKEIKVTVKVTDDGKGKLNSEIFYENDDQTFKNTYSVTKTNVQLSVKKVLTGRKLKAQEFEFDLVDNTEVSPTVGKILQTVKNNANGEVNFKSLEYTKAGTYEYFIRENKGSAPGVTYDQKFITVTVEVKEKSGKLEVSKVTYMTDGEEIKKPTFNNRYTPVKTSAKLEVKKVLTGRPLQEGEFEFELKDLQRNKKILETVKNTADGKVQFKELKYTKAGIYHYTISEKAGDVPGVEYEPNLISATVTVEDKGGKLEVTKITYSKAGEETKHPTFENRYTPGKTFARLEVNKVLTGRQLQKDEFEFELTGKEDHIHQTKKNTATGKIQFDTIEYDKAGEYHYTIKEKNNGLTGVTYDSSKVKVTVKVTDDGKGKLSTTVTYDGGKKNFKNTFIPKEITVPLQVTKALTGRNLQDDEFEFELYDGQNKLLQTVKNKADGTIPFTALKFTKTGLYNYLIKEKAGKVPGVDYDKQPIKVTIRVQQEEDGQLIYNIVYLGFDESGKNKISKQSFTNKYTAKGTDATFSVTKKLTGRALKDGEFSFDLKEDGKADVLQTKKNDKYGKVQFDAIKYQTVGTRKYTITEKNTGLGGVTYDTKTIKVTVEVTDNGKGQLVSKVTYENNDQTFTNQYQAAPTDAQLSANKQLSGRDLKTGEFNFELKNDKDEVLETVTNDKDGKITFKKLTYTAVGTYQYTITEKDTKLGGVKYDTKVIKATVTVTDNGAGKLVATVSYDTKDRVFNNTYTADSVQATVEVTKKLVGRTLKANEFEFVLKDERGQVLQTKKNAADGSVNFDAFEYKTTGTYHYTIAEKDTKLQGITYDKKVIKVTVTVTDDGNGHLVAKVSYDKNIKTFENRYTPPKKGLPKTGTVIHTVAIFIGLIVLVGAVYLIKKKS